MGSVKAIRIFLGISEVCWGVRGGGGGGVYACVCTRARVCVNERAPILYEKTRLRSFQAGTTLTEMTRGFKLRM